MWGQGKVVGIIAIVLFILLAGASYFYTVQLEEEREAKVSELMSYEEYAECLYDESTCPQMNGNIQIPNLLGVAILLIALILAGYLLRSDYTQQKILQELRRADTDSQEKEKLDLILSILKEDEKKVLLAVREQAGISQNTLRLRTDFSKAKLSNILKELDTRGLIKKEMEGKTNKLYLKRKM